MRVGTRYCWDWAQGAEHLKHLLHARDTGRVETQRLVEHRALPIRNGARTIEERGAGRDTQLLGLGRAQEHTTNILLMFVTLDVSRLSGWLNADALCRVERRAYRRCGVRGAAQEAGGRGPQWRRKSSMML